MTRGTTATNHSEECRKRFAKEREKVGDERLERETERLSECLEGEENRQKKAKTCESSGESKATASSSGPAVPEGEAPRSTG